MKKLLTLILFVFCAVQAFGQYSQANCPSIGHVADCLTSIRVAKQMGAKSVRISLALDSRDVLKIYGPSTDLKTVMDEATKDGVSVQWLLFAGMPKNATLVGYVNVPDPAKAIQVAALAQPYEDQIFAARPSDTIELFNEPDGIKKATNSAGVPLWQIEGHRYGWVSSKVFAGFQAWISAIDFHGMKLCFHLVGGGGDRQLQTQQSFYDPNGQLIVNKVYASGGFCPRNLYPNMAYDSTNAVFVNRYIGVTVANTFTEAKIGPLGKLRCKIGEVGVRATGLIASKCWSLRQALMSALVKAKLDFTWFTMISTDTASSGMALINNDGTWVYKPLSFAP